MTNHHSANLPLYQPTIMSASSTIDMRAWNRISPGYQAGRQISVDAAHDGPFLPSEAELRLLGDVAGRRILEPKPSSTTPKRSVGPAATTWRWCG